MSGSTHGMHKHTYDVQIHNSRAETPSHRDVHPITVCKTSPAHVHQTSPTPSNDPSPHSAELSCTCASDTPHVHAIPRHMSQGLSASNDAVLLGSAAPSPHGHAAAAAAGNGFADGGAGDPHSASMPSLLQSADRALPPRPMDAAAAGAEGGPSPVPAPARPAASLPPS
eukprot:121081-Chlamydomonas_euryale.AAC.1